MNQLDEKPDKSHDQKPDPRSPSDLGEFLPVGFRTFLHEVDGVLRELAEGLDEDLVEAFFF